MLFIIFWVLRFACRMFRITLVRFPISLLLNTVHTPAPLHVRDDWARIKVGVRYIYIYIYMYGKLRWVMHAESSECHQTRTRPQRLICMRRSSKSPSGRLLGMRCCQWVGADVTWVMHRGPKYNGTLSRGMGVRPWATRHESSMGS